ncbi:V-type ATP synthase subunit D [Entomospira culicis]|uniref:V-type ATP synthase subunit D n=1 Tax=Entomospira culicis TaxID=2719989 RepID=A0A968GG11_9SPIO|nr:V-type ATP synthase subunit D [Entomospira culicis]NIZ19468.1 V-type ATP synthase subunit D [Entomospira culicis]NIZ69627.1 V-type ATP synthase subunit D [Entomospira culicis]WDI36738.1 V-type ATP synthase subunit D [Entomospira culicis]WDI38367.1 V-type ATP synthase subunit D [Entomospira culicis]
MAKIKLTKNELKKQKDALKMFKRYLPTLTLKKQQLQAEIRSAQAERDNARDQHARITEEFMRWVAVFSEEVPQVESFFTLESLQIKRGNIAGVDIPIFESASFKPSTYNLFTTPLWVDKAAKQMMMAMEWDIRRQVYDKKVELLEQELRTTSQRVNLFEKVKIPETQQNIKKINIFLGDEQTATVVRGKISKKKLSEHQEGA